MEKTNDMCSKVVVAAHYRGGDSPIVRCPFIVNVHFRAVGFLRIKVFARVEYFTIEIMIKPSEGFLYAASRIAWCRTKFVA